MCTRKYPADWKSILLEVTSSREPELQNYSLELIEFTFSHTQGDVLLMVPGFFQNAFVFDLCPEEGISLARYLAAKFGFHLFALHPNGIGRSDYIPKSNLDDIAIDDIRESVNWLQDQSGKRIYVLGHSNGAIALQAYFSGLLRSDRGNVFDHSVAEYRQKQISGCILLAGNVCMSDGSSDTKLKKISRMGVRLNFVLRRLAWINACILTRWISPTWLFGSFSVAHWRFWSFLYERTDISKTAQAAVYNNTLDGTSSGILMQCSAGVLNPSIVSDAGESYSESLAAITLPLCQVTFECDPLAPPESTRKDSFNRIGSHKKEFVIIQDRGHEDCMLHGDFHQLLAPAFHFILN